MRLLNTKSLQLQEFFERDTPPYAILSHRWGADEILYNDMVPTADQSKTQQKHGYAKLLGSCNLAQQQDYEWIWIDTCCIDKSSSAELTEAINSMYQWYEAAEVCYAYLDDVESQDTFTESKWFTRGWTLQELIAPGLVMFYSAAWEFIGTKRSLVSTIAAKSQVDVQVLMGGDPLEMSVARRMYWASHRVTTRVEDEAYCLLGLFGVNMPLIYGEGRKAFRRLQEEIIRLNDDQSILAWYATEEADGTAVDFLASGASDFQESGDIAAHPYRRTGQEAMMITSQGLSVELCQLSVKQDEAAGIEGEEPFGEVDAILDCQIGSIPGTFPSIRLRRQGPGGRQGYRQHYYRIISSSGFQSRFSVQRDQFESCSLKELRDDEILSIGHDPTQLNRGFSQDKLGWSSPDTRNNSICTYIARSLAYLTVMLFSDRLYNHVPWRQNHVVIRRPLISISRRVSNSPASSNQGSWAPWSLLLASSTEADQTGFWFVFYTDSHPSWPEIRIDDVYPPERFDLASRQLRTNTIPQKYYNLHRFKIVDGIIRFSVVTTRPPTEMKLWPKLLVGRQATSRRQTPKPWCEFVDSGPEAPDDFVRLYEKYRAAPDGPESTSIDVPDINDVRNNNNTMGRNMHATVREKEISGVMFYLVALELSSSSDLAEKTIILQREDPHDRKSRTTEKQGVSEPLRL